MGNEQPLYDEIQQPRIVAEFKKPEQQKQTKVLLGTLNVITPTSHSFAVRPGSSFGTKCVSCTTAIFVIRVGSRTTYDDLPYGSSHFSHNSCLPCIPAVRALFITHLSVSFCSEYVA